MSYREVPWSVAQPQGSSARELAATALRLASVALAVLARRVGGVGRVRAVAEVPPVLEFYAEAGAPEGALYVDGKLFGQLPGVTRL